MKMANKQCLTPKCRCYINMRYYSKVFSTGRGTLKGYRPCPIHEPEDLYYTEKEKGECDTAQSATH